MVIRPVRLRLSRAKGFDLQLLSHATNGLPAVNVARPTKWGNPWKPGDMYRGTFKVVDLRHAFVLFRAEAPMNETLVAAARDELRGRNLACWCAGPTCHADVLLKIANA